MSTEQLDVLHLQMRMLPSINQRTGTTFNYQRGRSYRFIHTKVRRLEAIEKQRILRQVAARGWKTHPSDRYSIVLHYWFDTDPEDLDNPTKSMLDALVKGHALKDDHQIDHLTHHKHVGGPEQWASITIYCTRAEPEPIVKKKRTTRKKKEGPS